jgi:hypothetical protein
MPGHPQPFIRRKTPVEYVLYIGGGVLVLILLLVIYISTRPTDFRVERSAQVDAPAGVIHAIINDLSQWQRWSPYDKRDPNMKKTLEGPPTGPGASYTWNGNNQVGEGRMTITESKPGELVAMRLQFSRPFKCDNKVMFTMVPSGTGTRVSWIMEGKNNFMSKAFGLLMNVDKMVGTDFEQGLKNLDGIAQADAQKTTS